MKRDKAKKLLGAMSLIDEKYVEEAMPDSMKLKKKMNIRRLLIAACVSAIILSLGLFLFVPFNHEPPTVEGYENSEYYEVIKALQTVTYRSNNAGYDNWFDRLFGGLFAQKNDSASGEIFDKMENITMGNSGAMSPSADADGGDMGAAEDVTDNQVMGVMEADKIKRTGRHIFYLDGNVLKAFSIAGSDSEMVGLFVIEQSGVAKKQWEFYLSEDGKTATIIVPYSNGRYSTGVKVLSLDVTDPAHIKEKGEVSVTGDYLSSRLTDGTLLLFTRFTVRTNPDFDKQEQFLPQIDSGEGMRSIAPTDIHMPEKLTNAMYTVIVKLDEDTLDMSGSKAFLSYSQEAYVSEDNIYVTRQYYESVKENNIVTSQTMTEITRVEYSGEELTLKGSTTVSGYIKDQYSLDEKDGILRVVTTSDIDRYIEKYTEDIVSVELIEGTSASLYCINIEDWSMVAKVERFAPKGETVRSVRFDGDYAYVCTAIQLKDPVFFFDLSDLSNITYKDTGTISGFSTSLVDLGDGFLMGIGVGSLSTTLKVEIYVEGEQGVESYCSYELENTLYSTEYKSYYINREKGLIGIGITGQYSSSEYLLLGFDGYRLNELLKAPLAGQNYNKRGVYVDGHFYMFGENDFVVAPVTVD